MKKYAVLGVAVVVALGLVASVWAACGSAKCGSGSAEKKVGCASKASACTAAQKAACAAEGKVCGSAEKKAGCAAKAKSCCGGKGAACAAKAKSCCGGKGAACAAKQAKAEAEHDHSYGKIDTQGLKSLVNSGATLTIVDARGGKWDDGKRIGDAVNVPAGSSESDIVAALPDKDALIVAYCSSLKCPASAKLADQLVELGYQNVVKYPGGIAEWIEEGYEVSD